MNTPKNLAAAALAEITKGYTNPPAHRKVSPLFPFSTISDVRGANELAGDYFFDPLAMREFGSKVESALYSGTLFITSEKSWDDKGRHYTLRYVVSTGMVFTLGCASRLATIDHAREIAREIAKALRESDLLAK